MSDSKTYIYGKHALREALSNKPETIKDVYLHEGFDDGEIKALIRKNKIPVLNWNIQKMTREARDIEEGSTHQGIIASLSTSKLVESYKEFMGTFEISNDSAFVILGDTSDPQNMGAVIRSAAAFGLSGVIVAEHNQSPLNGGVVKVSAGMAFRIPILSVGNINDTIRDLKEKGFWIYGLDGESKQNLNEEDFEKPSVFVLGNEATGIREKTREACDIMLRIPMHSRTESLNAASSASIVFYAWSREHKNALK